MDGTISPLKAIRENCIDCCGGSSNEVKLCPSKNCFLHPFRFGENPFRKKREYTEEQKASMNERIEKARQARLEKLKAVDK